MFSNIMRRVRLDIAKWSRTHEANGKQCIAVCWGRDSRAKGIIGSYFVLSEHNKSREGKKKAVMITIDGEKYKADTWYTLKDGEVEEAV